MSDIKTMVNESSDHSYDLADAALIRDAVKLQFNKPLGSRYNLNDVGGLPNDYVNHPGICAFRVFPIPGVSNNAHSTLNIATQSEYAYLRNMLKRANNYDKEDLMIYQLAVDSIVYMYTWGLRALEACFTYSATNRYYGESLVRAMGFDYSSITADLAQARYDLTIRARKLVQYVVPSQISIFARHAWLFRHVYADMKINKCQMYLMNPGHYYLFKLDSSGAGMLESHQVYPHATAYTWTQYLGILDSMINAIYGDEDAGNISADILTAFGDNVIRVEVPSEEPDFIAKSVPDVLTQLQNAILFPDFATADFNITQSTANGLTCRPQAFISAGTSPFVLDPTQNGYCNSHILNLPYEQPTDLDILKATRFIAATDTWGTDTSGNEYGRIRTAGTELFGMATIFAYDNTTHPVLTGISFATYMSAFAGASDVERVAELSKFDWHPRVTILDPDFANNVYYGTFGVGYNFMDYAVTAPLSNESLENLHEVALIASFSVPTLGIFGKG